MQLSIANFTLEIKDTNRNGVLSNQFQAFANKLVSPKDFSVEIINQIQDNYESGELLFEANYSINKESTETFWQIRKVNNELVFLFGDYFTREYPIVVAKTLNKRDWIVHTKIKNEFGFDPFPHPAGDILLFHMLSEMNGIAMHASAVEHEGKGYLFTGFSGIGKSTMAKLWQEIGATIINDDRIFIRNNEDGGYTMYNSPMPYYVDIPKSAPLSGMFLLKQAPQNGYTKLQGAQAMSRITAHCLQHNYDKTFVSNLLRTTSSIASQVPIFELDVFPDVRITELIKNLI